MEEGGVADEADGLVGREGRQASAGSAAQAHADVVVHQGPVGGHEEKNITARVAVEEDIQGPALVLLPHVLAGFLKSATNWRNTEEESR